MRNRICLFLALFCWMAYTLSAQTEQTLPPNATSSNQPSIDEVTLLNDLDEDSLQISQQIELPTPPAKVNLSGFDLSMTDEGLVFSSPQSNGQTNISINGEEVELNFRDGKALHPLDTDYKGQLIFINNPADQNSQIQLYHLSKRQGDGHRLRSIPLWMSLIPPLIAIFLALVFKEVILSLFVGIWSGAFIAGGLRLDSFYYFFDSIYSVVAKYIKAALYDESHISIIVFSLLIGGMVAIISRNGGMGGVVQSLSKYARSPRSTQFITWLLGVAIFFDDYANTLIVGNTMRSVTDKFKISREKLAYIVDSTAAPVSAIAFITTWIGAELSYIGDAVGTLEGFDTGLTPYSIFISSLKYSFYPILTLIFILILIYTRRDYGAMLKAENRARRTGQVSPAATSDEDEPNMEDLTPVKGAPLKWYNAALPVLMVIFVTLFGLIDTGMESLYNEIGMNGKFSWGTVWGQMGSLFPQDNPSFFMKMGKLIGSSDSYVALIWASFAGVALAVIMTLAGRIMKLHDTMHTMVTGFKTMLPALVILTLAWSLASTTDELHTADFLTQALQDSVSPYLMPVIIFILAAFIAFSTGSSWSTMAILYPIAIPTTWAICIAQGVDPDVAMEILLNVIAVVLAASVVGDHCSPISDTTILSSLASDCNHIDHVRTQLPYALTVGTVSLIAAGVSTLLGGGWFICFVILIISVVILTTVVLRVGKVVED